MTTVRCHDIGTLIRSAEFGKKWTLTLIYKGPNEKNLSGHSNKWWSMSGTGTGRVEINFGAAHSMGRSTPVTKTYSEAMKVLNEKLFKGYTFFTPTPVTTASHMKPLAGMGAPFCNIVKLLFSDNGTPVDALDESGRVVVRIPLDTARSLAKQYPDLAQACA